MGIASGMKALTEEIITARNIRIKALGDLVFDTKKTLADFAEERRDMGYRQGKDLSDFVNGLSKSVGDMLGGFHKDHGKMSSEQTKRLNDFAKILSKSTERMLNQFSKDRRHMSADQARHLSDFAKKITKNVHNILKEFHKNHQQMSDEQAKNLADFVNNLTRDVSTLVNGFKDARGEMSAELKSKLGSDMKHMEAYVKDKLKEFEKSHGKMSDALRKSLAAYANDSADAVKKLLQTYRTDMKQAKGAWKGISSTVAGPKAGEAASSIEFTGKVAPVQEVIQQDQELKEVHHEIDIDESLLGYVNGHPEGVKAGDMEPVFGISRMRLGVIAKKLLEDGKVRKEGSLYYPL